MPFAPMGPELGSICANNSFVYVLRGNTLYQFSADDLKLVKKVKIELERDMPFTPFRQQIREERRRRKEKTEEEK